MDLPCNTTVAHCATTIDAVGVFTRAQAVWNERFVPPYESFTLPCGSTFLAARCIGDPVVQFIVRLSDGRSYAQTLDSNGRPGTVLLRGGYVYGPAGAPFGFYRRRPVPGATAPPAPPNLAADPIATIATVSAVDRAYDITLVGIETIDTHRCYHLRLRPLRDARDYPLRELWVDTSTYDVVRLTYLQPFNANVATVTYDFAPVGPQAVWSIVHIDATSTIHDVLATHTDHVSEDLHDIQFPLSEPENDFVP
jgi:hypothetical protein